MSKDSVSSYTHLEDMYCTIGGFELLESCIICKVKQMSLKGGVCYMSQDAIADEFMTTRKTVNEKLRNLIKLGIIIDNGCVLHRRQLVYNKEFDDMKRLVEVSKTQKTSVKNKDKLMVTYNLKEDVVDALIDWSDIPRNKYHNVPRINSYSFVTNDVIKQSCKELQNLDHNTQLDIIKVSVKNNWAKINYEWYTNSKNKKQTNSKPRKSFREENYYDD